VSGQADKAARATLPAAGALVNAAHSLRPAARFSRKEIPNINHGGEMNSVVHFEMPYVDRVRMSAFYDKAFGWETRGLGEEMGNYVLATTTETDESGPKRPGAINGGFFPQKPDGPAQYPRFVIAVDNIQESITKVRHAGGRLLGEPDEVPGVGKYVSFIDTEGNRVSMLQPVPRNWHAPETT
jgi:predicted enzyme related to lactoylglutathione lyase